MALGFFADFKRFFLRGLAAVLPTVVTIALLVWVFSLIQTYAGDYLNTAVAESATQVWVWATELQDPDQISRVRGEIFEFYHRWLFWLGFLMAIVGVYVFGRFIGSFVGRTVWRFAERTLSGLPIIKAIYPSAKQVTDFLLAERKKEFSRVVAVEYPRKGIWSVGLVTNAAMRSLHRRLEGDLITVFIPSSPTPVTGYTITVRRDEVIDLPISIDEALKFTISGGVIQPTSERMDRPEPTPPKETTQ